MLQSDMQREGRVENSYSHKNSVYRKSGPCFWLSIFAVASSLVLLSDLVGFTLPRGFIYWTNPIAWLSNALGFTAYVGFYCRGMDAGLADVWAYLSIPVIGTFIAWFGFGWFRWRWPILVFIVFVIPFFIAMQFTMQRGYESLADRFLTQEDVKGEADALSKALFIVKRSETPDLRMFELSSRLLALQQREESLRPANPDPIQFRIAEFDVILESGHAPIESGLDLRRTNAFSEFQQLLATIGVDFEIDTWEEIDPFDVRYYVAVSVVGSLLTARSWLKESRSYSTMHQALNPSMLVVQIHKDAKSLEDAVRERPHSTSRMPGYSQPINAFYDRKNGSMHISVPEYDYREQLLKMQNRMTGVFANGGDPVFDEKEATANFEFQTKYISVPVAHEIWHFMADKSHGSSDFPIVVEEGFASILEFLQESIDTTAAKNAELFSDVGLPGTYLNTDRAKKLLDRLVECGPRQLKYRGKVLKASEEQEFVSTETLLTIGPSFLHLRNDRDLVYAEAWALAMILQFHPNASEYLSGIKYSRARPSSSADILAELDSLIIVTAEESCRGNLPSYWKRR
jgi:hypothetical protein